MASRPSPGGSKRHNFGKAIRHSYGQFKHAVLSPSGSTSRIHGSAVPSNSSDLDSAGSPCLAPSATPSQSTVAQTVPSQGSSPTAQSAGPSIPRVSLVLTTTNTASKVDNEPNAIKKFREVQGAAWAGLETALRMLAKGANALPPLKSAVSEFIDCLDIVQAAATNVEDYEKLTSELTTMAGTLSQYLSELYLEDPGGSTARIALSIEAEVAHISKQQGRGKGRRIVESTEDKQDVIKGYRRIEGLFRRLQSDISLRTWRNTNEQHITALLRGMAPVDDARYNSSYSTTIKRCGCTAETREKVQADLQDWVRDPNAAKVYWMNGMAGTGKTTIAYSLCEWLEANQRLGAGFFCSRVSSSCRNVNWIVPTIAYQLARYSPSFQSALCKVLKEDPDVSKLNVVRQFEKLVREPMLASKDAMPDGVVVVIDALDECEDDYGVRLVLGTLLRLGVDLPLKFFVLSRPEPAIRDNMLSPGRYPPAVLHLHDIEQSVVEDDIKKYLTDALSSMSPPPSPEQIAQLAKRSGKLFIYAATAVRYILPGKGPANSLARLHAMLATNSQSTDEEQVSKKYKKLDELYTTVLAAAFDEEELEKKEIVAMRLVLWTAVCAKEPMTTPAMASLLGLAEEQATSALQPLRSVLHVSEASGLVSTLHASFPDYILDHARSRNFYCNQTQHCELLANRCFDVMEEQLRFNICDIRSSFVFDKDVPDLEQRIKANISPTLFYACRYWGEHLQLAGDSVILHDKLVDFLCCRLLFWMEVLNFGLWAVKGVPILIQAENWLSAAKTSADTRKQAADARDFVARFAGGACTRSTPHIYLSSLPFCAKSSSVYTHYWENMHGLMDVKGTAMYQRDSAAQTTWNTNSPISSLALSPDGTRIVSGSLYHTIQVWDAHTGNAITGPLQGHTLDSSLLSKPHDQTKEEWGSRWQDLTANLERFEAAMGSVKAVGFSPDGTHVVSGSGDRTVRVWNVYTGDTVAGPLKGHTSSVTAAEFSPDGTRIVSSSRDRTLRVWDARSGDTIAGPFKGHTGEVNSVAFSPEGTRIVSGSHDQTLRVWDAHTGDTIIGPFEGHSYPVHSVAFSPDGTCIVSGSGDHTVRVWDANTGNTIAGPFKGHTDIVISAEFSPDSTRIVSGSHDRTIRVWDVSTGDVVAGPFKGHTGSVNSVTFFPDGARIVSSSTDQTIRVWDLRSSDIVAGQFEGHSSSVNSVVFSPDGTRIISGSNDQTIRMWDTHTGGIVTRPFIGHTGAVNAVAFSPDGTHIVSGSADRTILVWDVHAGSAVGWISDTHWVNSVAFSPDGTSIVSGSNNGIIQVWDIHTSINSDTGAEPFKQYANLDWGEFISSQYGPDPDDDCEHVREEDLFPGLANSVSFSPDGTRIVSGSHDQTIRVWDIHTDDIVTRPFEGHTSAVGTVAFSPDGARVVSGSFDSTVRVWNASTGDIIAGPFEGHTGEVSSVAFSPDGTCIVSGSGDRTVRVWDANTGDIIAGPFEGHADRVNSVAFSPDGSHIVSGADDGAIRVWSGLFKDHIDPQLNPIQQGHVHGAFTDISNFKLNNDGWLTTSLGPLLWVPPDLHANMPFPHNTLVIGLQGSIYIENPPITVGERWSECYRSQ